MQNVSTMINRPVQLRTAAATGLLAFVAGIVLAVEAPTVAVGISASHNSVLSLAPASVGGELIAHNRSEQRLGGFASVGGEQVAHNRSEQDLANR